jgi:hypothetical protein
MLWIKSINTVKVSTLKELVYKSDQNKPIFQRHIA